MALYKKGGFRRMNQMNGDFLTQLKEPLRSEMNRNVLGTNQAFDRMMNKNLDLYYKEQNITMETLRRKQGDVYGTMLRVHREKKTLQRAAFQRSQQESRGKALRSKDGEADVLIVALEKEQESKQSQAEAKDITGAKGIERIDKGNRTMDSEKKTNETDNGDNTTMQVESSETKTKPKKKKKVKPASDENVRQTNEINDDNYKRTKDGPSTNRNSSPTDPHVDDSRRDYVKTSRVLEVSKNAPLAPIVRERSTLTAEDIGSPIVDDLRLSPTKPRNTALAPLAEDVRASVREVSVSDIAIDSVAEAQKDSAMFRGEQPQQRVKLESLGGEHMKRLSKSSMAMPTISESKGDLTSRNIVTRHSDGSIPEGKKPKKKRKKVPPIQIAFEDPEPCTDPGIPTYPEYRLEAPLSLATLPDIQAPKPLSQVEKNRRRALRKLRQRHKILDDEQFPVYVKGMNGTYIPSLTPFRRKQFAPPSMREKHIQEKMLRAQVQARLDQRQKLERFFERMAHEERERQKLREAFKRAKEQEAEEARRNLAEQEKKLGFSASQLATMYSRGILPPGIDPSSFEAIAYCKYIRTYSPTSQREHSDENKHSSWS